MRSKFTLQLAAAALLAVLGTSAAKADTLKFYGVASTFPTNDTLFWASLGNNATVPDGTVATSAKGILTTITFGKGGNGSTYVECPATSWTWAGNFAPGQTLLTNIDQSSFASQGFIDLGFSQGIAGAGFKIQANIYGKFQAEIAAYDGSTLLGTFFDTGSSNGSENNSAIFMGILDQTAADITSIDIATFNCDGGKYPQCNGGGFPGFAINRLTIQDTSASATPEPASLLLLSSGIAALGFLRRKTATRG